MDPMMISGSHTPIPSYLYTLIPSSPQYQPKRNNFKFSNMLLLCFGHYALHRDLLDDGRIRIYFLHRFFCNPLRLCFVEIETELFFECCELRHFASVLCSNKLQCFECLENGVISVVTVILERKIRDCW